MTAEDFVSVTTTLEDVQRKLLDLVSSETILLGHSLESDLRALKVVALAYHHTLFTSLSPSDGSQLCGGHCNCLPSSQGASPETSSADAHERALAEVHSGQCR